MAIVTAAPAPPAGRQAGSSLVMALFLVIFCLGVVISGAATLRSTRARTDTQFLIHGQAITFARSALVESINWYRRQETQPVTSFTPVLDPVGPPPVLDTIDPDIGLVREFKITANLWGRYEVWKQWDADPDPVRLAWRQRMQARDVSSFRKLAPGNAWDIKCISYIYRRVNPALAFDEHPNQVLATETLSTEITRLTFALPGAAALCARNGGTITIAASAEVLGGSAAAGIYQQQGTGSPTITGTVTGVPPVSPAAIYDDALTAVFGVGEAGLRAMADDHVTDPAEFPASVPDNALLFVEAGALSFTPSRPLLGRGIVCVVGDVTIAAGSNSLFSGLLYVDGDLSITGPAELQGAIIATGSVSVSGGSDIATLRFSQDMLAAIQDAMGSYRVSRSIVRAHAP